MYWRYIQVGPLKRDLFSEQPYGSARISFRVYPLDMPMDHGPVN